ncbi:MAG: Holliday junction branch migration protein RuvA [Ignavibacteria bacterium]
MIEYIEGILISKKPTGAIVDTGGIAFSISITIPAFENLPQPGSKAKILTHLHIKENPFSFVLYGFSDANEREMFKNIISVSGIGPKTAMSILSAITYAELSGIINSGNYMPLTSISGVGRKTAERLVLELKDKISKGETEFIPSALNKDGLGEISKISSIVSALVSLGYNRIEADKLVKNFAQSKNLDEFQVEDVIKEILRGSK